MKPCPVEISADVERIREAERNRSPLQAQRLRQWEEELAARDALLRQYLKWALEAGVRPLTRRGARRLGIDALYRRRDRLWLVAQGGGATSGGATSRGARAIAGVYASGDTVVRGLKAHQLAERIAQRVGAAELRPGDGRESFSAALGQWVDSAPL